MRLLTRKPIVVNIDGYEWKRAKWSNFARWFLKLSEAAVRAHFVGALAVDVRLAALDQQLGEFVQLVVVVAREILMID
ncbi:DUF1972 domain-containing protein, partial [Pantoea sp. SIMBA_072]